MDTPRKPRRWARLAVVTLAGLSMVGALSTTAFAQTNNDDEAPAEGGERPKKPELTDEQRACIEQQGVDLPDPEQNAGDGNDQNAERPRRTEAEHEAFRAAAQACGVELPAHHHRPRLTDEQRACLEQQGVEKPARDENGERLRPTDEQRAAFEAAAETCGIDLPQRPDGDNSEANNGNGQQDQTPDANGADQSGDAT